MKKNTQNDFEGAGRERLLDGAFSRKLAVAATLFCQQTFGRQHIADASTPPRIVAMFGRTETAVDCMDYLLQRIVESGAVCDAYKSYEAMYDIWQEFSKFHTAGVKFAFDRVPNETFRGHLRLVTNK
ncbi:hypothetical protein A2671_00385 [Candidatus Kaiserbacteria bacterium RIFCSPHIGHO2_01_FULL_49_13]|uniref:Uncharacterized protein n=1 Tax=Candidatus Kaiserbacteria bacterium RIFCSPHIGHO2_01_FULL_49_13 TaxID=1798477 RepID=A0A1F6CDB2_9BACT|nr:MAG: hypothetical protein A2671_00385 [Candidatus Kaiserbacteria bacterium RIFCSPHIGHO2_01_FULL_49_13]